jgi:hypothetical protein
MWQLNNMLWTRKWRLCARATNSSECKYQTLMKYVSPCKDRSVQWLIIHIPYRSTFSQVVVHLVLEAWWRLSAHSDAIHPVPEDDHLHHHSPPAEHVTSYKQARSKNTCLMFWDQKLHSKFWQNAEDFLLPPNFPTKYALSRKVSYLWNVSINEITMMFMAI